MYSRSRLIAKYLRYYFSSSNSKGHGTHSPFVFDFITKVLNDKNHYPVYTTLEAERHRLLGDHTTLNITDFGAGSTRIKTNKRKLSEIARHSLKPKKYASLLFRMAAYFQPQTILELGTSLGLTTAYLASARPTATVYTFEGAAEVAIQAKSLFDKTNLQNIVQITGNFDETVRPFLSGLEKADFVFIDGNHRYQPTVNYLHQLLPVLHEYSVVIMDDIHWSEEMENAWSYCRKVADVTLSIDLFFIGILFFRKEFRVPQHFSIRF